MGAPSPPRRKRRRKAARMVLLQGGPMHGIIAAPNAPCLQAGWPGVPGQYGYYLRSAQRHGDAVIAWWQPNTGPVDEAVMRQKREQLISQALEDRK